MMFSSVVKTSIVFREFLDIEVLDDPLSLSHE